MAELPSSLDVNAVLLREAIYGVVACCSHDLFDYIDFDQWLTSIYAEVQNPSKEFKLVRRRISNILGSWVSVKCSKQNRVVLYEIMQYLLRPEEDLVCRLTAVVDLKKIVDDFDFENLGFQGYLQPIVDNLMKLLAAVGTYDSRLQIMNTIVVMVERMEGQVTTI
jgi:hypothetical protein